MDTTNPLQQLLVRGLGTTTLVAERLRGVTQAWGSSGRLDPAQASTLVEEVLASLRGENPELEKQAERTVAALAGRAKRRTRAWLPTGSSEST